MNQKEIEAAAIMMRIFLTGLALNFEANYHELEGNYPKGFASEAWGKSKREVEEDLTKCWNE